MKYTHTNRSGDKFIFTLLEDNNVQMIGNFHRMRSGEDFIDPSGGPFLRKGETLSHQVAPLKEFNIIVDGFKSIEGGYLILTKPNNNEVGKFDHLNDSGIIGTPV